MNDIRTSRKSLAGFAAIGAAWATYFAQMPVLKAQVGASDGAYGAAILWAALGAIAAMWLAPAARKRAGGAAVPACIVLLALGMLGAGLSHTLLMLTFMLLLVSAASGVIDVLVNNDVAEAEARTGKPLMNLNHGLYSIAYGCAALLVAFLRGANVGPVAVFAVMLVFLAALAWISRGLDAAPEDDPALVGTSRLPLGLILIAGACVLCAFLSEAAAEGWSALHIERTLGGAAALGAMGPAILGFTMGAGRLSGHALSHLMPERTLMTLACLLSAAGLGWAAAAQSVAAALCGFALAGLGISVLAPLALAATGRAVPQRFRLAVISRVSVIGYGAFFFGPPLMGLVSEYFGLRVSFAVIAGLLVVTGLVAVPLLMRYSRPPAAISRS